jgi:hypothetical protein
MFYIITGKMLTASEMLTFSGRYEEISEQGLMHNRSCVRGGIDFRLNQREKERRPRSIGRGPP